MHQLALNMIEKGYTVSGSDDEIFEPSKSVLQSAGLLPAEFGWFPEKVTEDLDAVILGMHARIDNPELLRAQALDLAIYSFPEFVYEQSKDKKRVVIAGSHGKTTITSMIMHVLGKEGKDFDFLVGARLEGFKRSVQIRSSSDLIILEGDEYLSSALERKPKFLSYRGKLCLITGIAWDHINVFPKFEDYCNQFRLLLRSLDQNAVVVYNEEDAILKDICLQSERKDIRFIPYNTPEYKVGSEGKVQWKRESRMIPLNIFGAHNLSNMNGARLICAQLGIDNEAFEAAISSFKGAARRLQTLFENETVSIFNDFAHAPSKVKASTKAVSELHSKREVVAVQELHTYSSLNRAFIPQYEGALDAADHAAVFYDPHTLKIKKLPAIDSDYLKSCFKKEGLKVFQNAEDLKKWLQSFQWKNKDLVFMSSGKLGGFDKEEMITFVSTWKEARED